MDFPPGLHSLFCPSNTYKLLTDLNSSNRKGVDHTHRSRFTSILISPMESIILKITIKVISNLFFLKNACNAEIYKEESKNYLVPSYLVTHTVSILIIYALFQAFVCAHTHK